MAASTKHFDINLDFVEINFYASVVSICIVIQLHVYSLKTPHTCTCTCDPDTIRLHVNMNWLSLRS